MKLVVGLGNPGEKYKNNRHNLGFMVLDWLVKHEGLEWKISADWVCHFAKGEETIYAKPSTFMNESGIAVQALADFYKIVSKDVLIVYDEVDLPFGKIRLSFDGISAGHKGIESIIKGLGSADFGRVRVGIGSPRFAGEVGRPAEAPHKNEVSNHVLEDFSAEEQKELEAIIKRASEAVKSYQDDGLEATMNRFN